MRKAHFSFAVAKMFCNVRTLMNTTLLLSIDLRSVQTDAFRNTRGLLYSWGGVQFSWNITV